jgi:hypothetical protein
VLAALVGGEGGRHRNTISHHPARTSTLMHGRSGRPGPLRRPSLRTAVIAVQNH